MKKVHILKKFFSKTRRNDDGSAAIEFAFTAPLLILTIVGIMEFSMILFLNALLEGSLRDAARFGVTGFTPAGVNREDVIVDKISSATMGLVPITAANVTALAYSDFSEVGQPEPYIDDSPANGQFDAGEAYTDINGNGQWDADMGTPGLGGACDVVVYRLETEWPLLLG
ncbi:MAG: pilus assembly protein, partial [Alphaproteobacteria bacterium]|nr:pilus assembly protein [Alphaproteobacteria bacterium]